MKRGSGTGRVGDRRGRLSACASSLGVLLLTIAPHPGAAVSDPPARSAIEEAISAAAGYLVRSVDDQGRLEYMRYLGGRRAGDSYNVVRHAGAIYALEQYASYRRASGAGIVSGPSAGEAEDALLRSARHLSSRYLDAIADGDGAMAVFSLPGEEVNEEHRVAKLGASGLGLVALVAAHRVDPEAVPLATLRRLGEGVLFFQREDGSFHSKYREAKGFDLDFVSLYYPGEAILGLSRLYSVDPDVRWRKGAVEGARFLVSSRLGSRSLPADHWLMIATEELLSDQPGGAPQLGKAAREHLWELAAQMLGEQEAVLALASGSPTRIAEVYVPLSEVDGPGIDVSRELTPGAEGGFVLDGRSAPTATRLEGLIAAYSVLEDYDPQRAQRLVRPLSLGVELLLRCQVTEGPARGGVVRSVDQRGPGRPGELRIDYTQHALSAWIGYLSVEGKSRPE